MVFGCGLTWNSVPHAGSGGDHQGTVRSPERVSESLDGAYVLFTDFHELREVLSESAVIESTVNYAIRHGRSTAQSFEVCKIPAMHLRRVDFPEPLRPMMPKVSPVLTSNPTSRSAQKSSCGT